MLKSKNTMATIAVSDIERASQFYEGVLGLQRSGAEGKQLLSYATGNTTLLVYHSPFARSNQATSATWEVGSDLDNIVATLKQRGLKFEHYDLPDTVRHGDIHVSGNIKTAWFKDPDGNILNLAGE